MRGTRWSCGSVKTACASRAPRGGRLSSNAPVGDRNHQKPRAGGVGAYRGAGSLFSDLLFNHIFVKSDRGKCGKCSEKARCVATTLTLAPGCPLHLSQITFEQSA